MEANASSGSVADAEAVLRYFQVANFAFILFLVGSTSLLLYVISRSFQFHPNFVAIMLLLFVNFVCCTACRLALTVSYFLCPAAKCYYQPLMANIALRWVEEAKFVFLFTFATIIPSVIIER